MARLDVLDDFCDLFPAIQTAIEIIAENVDGKYIRSKVDKVKPFFMGTVLVNFKLLQKL